MRWFFALALALPALGSAQTVCSDMAASETACSATVPSGTPNGSCVCAGGPGFNHHLTMSDGLVTYWRLDEESGSRVDIHGPHDLTDTNTVGFVATTPPPNFAPIAKASRYIAANAEYLSVAARPVAESTPRSIAFWFRTSDVTQVKGLYGVGDIPQDATPQWFLRLNGSVLSLYSGIDEGGTHDYRPGPTTLSNNTWYHVVYSYGHPGQFVYLNNVLEITDADGKDGVSFNDASTFIGVAFPGFITADIAHLSVWNRVLTAQERADLYNSGNGLFY